MLSADNDGLLSG